MNPLSKNPKTKIGREDINIETIIKLNGVQNINILIPMAGLGSRFSHKPSELSGGERQRVAIARALVNTPKCVLLDEPTGNLDKFTAGQIQSLLIDLNDSFDTSFIVVTHDELMANSMHRKLVLEGGTLHE